MNIFFGHEPTHPVQKPSPSKRGYNIDHPENFFAGKLSYYGETNYRYANRSSMDGTNPNEHSEAPKIYSSKALKNMSGLKLY